jgi:hypothetical protein
MFQSRLGSSSGINSKVEVTKSEIVIVISDCVTFPEDDTSQEGNMSDQHTNIVIRRHLE